MTTPTVTGDGASDLSTRTRAAVTHAVKVFAAYKLTATAELVTARLTCPPEHSVVVLGEVGRGKSSLVNALLQKQLSPVGDTTTTAIPIIFRPGDSLQATLRIPNADPVAIPVGQLARWATAPTGQLRHSSSDAMAFVEDPAPLPTAAVVTVPMPPGTGDVPIIDTPGVGGLDPDFARIAIGSAANSAVVVMVCDGSAPVSKPEMQFLQQVCETVQHVIVAVTKTDKNLRRWRVSAETNRRLIREHVGRDLPVVGVSAVLAAMSPSGDRESFEAVAGITALRELILGATDSARRAPLASSVSCALTGLRGIAAQLDEQIAAVTGGGDVVDTLSAERDRLAELQKNAQEWEHFVQRDMAVVRREVIAHLEAELAEVREKWTGKINNSSLDVLRRSPQHYVGAIERDLHAVIASALDQLSHRLDAYVGDLFDGPDSVEVADVRAAVATAIRSESEPVVSTAQPASRRHGLLDPSVLTIGAIGTSMLGALTGIGAAAGVLWVGINLGYKAIRTGKTNLLTWLRETLTTTRNTTVQLVDTAVAAARPEIILRRRQHLADRIAELQGHIKTATTAQQEGQAARTSQLDKLTGNRRIVTAGIGALENLLVELTEDTSNRVSNRIVGFSGGPPV